MRGLADMLAFVIIGLVAIVFIGIGSDTWWIAEERMSGDILDVSARRVLGATSFAITLDLDSGSVVVCPVQSDLLGGTLYRLYRNRKPDFA